MTFQETTEARLKLGVHLAEKFLAQKPWANLDPEADVTFEAIMLFFFCKSYKTYQAIAVLWRAGFYEDAPLLTRTLFEIWMQAAYIGKSPKERAREFQEHDPVRMYRAYLALKKHGEHSLTAVFESRHDFAEIERQHYLRDATSHSWWFGRSLHSLANKLGFPFDKEYLVGYWWQSNLVHSSVTSMQHYATDSLELNCHPGNREPGLDVKIAPKSATAYFISITQEISEALHIDMRADVQLAWTGLQGTRCRLEDDGLTRWRKQ